MPMMLHNVLELTQSGIKSNMSFSLFIFRILEEIICIACTS